jgi:hypothetical protein
MRRILIAAVVAAAAACSSGSAQPTTAGTGSPTPSVSSTTGTVAGRLLIVGGPYPGIRRGLSGTVSVHTGSRMGPVITTVPTDAKGFFRVDVPAGRYLLTGRSFTSNLTCFTEHPVAVAAARTAHAAVICPVP